MDYKELKQKSVDELKRLLIDTREILRNARFSVRQKQLKNIRKVRAERQTIARILTLLREKKEEL